MKERLLRPELAILAVLDNWHRSFTQCCRVPWSRPLPTHFQEATDELVRTMKSDLGHKSGDPYLVFCRHTYEMHENGNEVPTDDHVQKFIQLYDICRIATFAYASVTRQDGAFEQLVSAIGQGTRNHHAFNQGDLSNNEGQVSLSETVPTNRQAPKKGKRKPDSKKRELIAEAMDNGINDYKNIRTFVAKVLKTSKKVSHKMISEVKKLRTNTTKSGS